MMKLLKFIKKTNGTISVEFILILPIFLYLMTAIYDMSTFVLAKNKIIRLAATISNDLTLQKTLTNAQIQATFNSASIIMSPFNSASVSMVVSHINNTGGISTVSWRSKSNSSVTSKINSAACSQSCGTNCGASCGTAANMPNGLVLTDGQNIIVTEVYYTYTPIIPASFFQTQSLYAVMSYVPRSGALSAAPT